MAELRSSMPTASGLCYASAMFKIDERSPLFSWVEPVSRETNLLLVQLRRARNRSLFGQLHHILNSHSCSHRLSGKEIPSLLARSCVGESRKFLDNEPTKLVAQMNTVCPIFNPIVLFTFIAWMSVGSVNERERIHIVKCKPRRVSSMEESV